MEDVEDVLLAVASSLSVIAWPRRWSGRSSSYLAIKKR